MGCRSFLTPYIDPETGKPKYYGRFNQGVVTINLVDVALSSGGNFDKFWKIFDERLAQCHSALLCRYAPKRRITQAARSIFCRKPVLRRICCSLHVLRKAGQSPCFACTLHSLHVAQSFFTTKSVLNVTDAVAAPSLGCQSSTAMRQSQRIGTATHRQQVMSLGLQQIFNCFAQLVYCRRNLPHSISTSAAV